MRRYVLTGGPGVGKSTLIARFAERGLHTAPEAAWQIIHEEGLEFVDTVGWQGAAQFQEKIAQRQLELEATLPNTDELLFLDRGLLDGIAYCALDNISTPKVILDNAAGRYTGVFLLDFLETYTMGPGRQDSPETAQSLHTLIGETYRQYGYTVVDVPAGDVESRCDYILNRIGERSLAE